MSIIALDRTCYELDNEGKRTSSDSVPVTDLLAMPAWVLLGEPGMGKTTTLKQLGGNDVRGYVRARDLSVKTAGDFHDSQIILVDGLDEFGDNLSVRNKLAQLARDGQFSSIGISSRYADWFQKRDHPDFKAMNPSLRVFVLEPLSEPQTLALAAHFLKAAQSQQNAQDFIQQAQQRGLGVMLSNPQLMAMLVKAIVNNKGDAWPQSRSEVYELACKQMLREHNANHEQAKDLANDLSAAGELCAIYLLSQSDAICTQEVEGSIANTKVVLPNLQNTPERKKQWERMLVNSKLLIKTSEHTFEPIHRTVAEYLAARYLAERLKSGLSVERVCAWLLAQDGGIVKNLRGLAGWLTALTTNQYAQQRLFDADPRAVLNYGDLTLPDTGAKTRLLKAVANQAKPEYVTPEAAKNYLPLVDSDMSEVVTKYLLSKERTNSACDMAYLLCTALEQSSNAIHLRTLLESVIKDTSWNDVARRAAMRALIHAHATNLSALVPWLEDIHKGKIEDKEANLRGELLQSLYPDVIKPAQVFDYYLETPMYWGANRTFWYIVGNPKTNHTNQAIAHLANALIAWLESGYSQSSESQYNSKPLGLDSIVPMAIAQSGGDVGIPTLYKWLLHYEIEKHSHGSNEDAKLAQESADKWIKEHPSLIQKAIEHCILEMPNTYKTDAYINRFKLYTDVSDYAAWYLDLATVAYEKTPYDDELVRSLIYRGYASMASEDTNIAKRADPSILFDWANGKTLGFDVNDVLQRHEQNHSLSAEYIQMQREHEEREAAQQLQIDSNIKILIEETAQIREAKNLHALHYFAALYAQESGARYYSNDPLSSGMLQALKCTAQLQLSVEQGFKQSVQLLNAGTLDEALNAQSNQRTMLVMLPALLGIEQLHQENPKVMDTLTKAQTESLFCFYFLSLFEDKVWLQALLAKHPAIAAEVWLQMAFIQLKVKQKYITRLYEVANKPVYQELAQLALPKLLLKYPLKFSESETKDQSRDFSTLLLGCIKNLPIEQTVAILKERLAKKSLSALQKAYSLMAGYFLKPEAFESQIEKLMNAQQVTILDLMAFLNSAGFPHAGKLTLTRLTSINCTFLVQLFARHCEPDLLTRQAHRVSDTDSARGFVHEVISFLGQQKSAEATNALRTLLNDLTLPKWHSTIESALTQQTELDREAHFKPASPQQIAKALVNTEPANHQDLLAIAIDQLSDLQNKLNGSELNYKNAYWHPVIEVTNGVKTKSIAHCDEEDCRDEIASRLVDALGKFGISLVTEALQAKAKRSDIQLRHLTPTSPDMRLPIEIKGVWHRELWTAPEKQLVDQYMNHPDCNRLGIYLVLWTGEIEKMKPAFRKAFPNGTLPRNLDTFKQQMTNHIKANAACKGIELFVLDISR